MKKIDYKKDLKHLYRPSVKKVENVDVPAMFFLMIDGRGDPNTSRTFQDAVETLYSVSYTLKFMIKKGGAEIDYAVMPLEGLWWMENMSEFSQERKDKWLWTVMIMQPDFITHELVGEVTEQVRKKKNLEALPLLRFERYSEGTAAQIMHIGPFSEEGPNIEKIHKHIHEQNCILKGRHHEIYLSDLRRTVPEKLKTVLRQPYSEL